MFTAGAACRCPEPIRVEKSERKEEKSQALHDITTTSRRIPPPFLTKRRLLHHSCALKVLALPNCSALGPVCETYGHLKAHGYSISPFPLNLGGNDFTGLQSITSPQDGDQIPSLVSHEDI